MTRFAIALVLVAGGCFDFDGLSRNFHGGGDLAQSGGDGALDFAGTPNDGNPASSCPAGIAICETFDQAVDGTFWQTAATPFSEVMLSRDAAKARSGLALHLTGSIIPNQVFGVGFSRISFVHPAFYARVWIRVTAAGTPPVGAFLRSTHTPDAILTSVRADSTGHPVLDDPESGTINYGPPLANDTWQCLEWDVANSTTTARLDGVPWMLTIATQGFTGFDVGYFTDQPAPMASSFDVWLDDLAVSFLAPPGC